MAMTCPACGGHLGFNPDTQVLECPYCDSVFDVAKYNLKNEGKKQSVKFEREAKQITVDVYACKHCGAELCAPKEQIVAYCMYCGGQATLLQKAARIQMPLGVIPFKFDKKEVCKRYSAAIESIPFVPKDFKDSNFIEGFRGIYIPYWKTGTLLKGERADLQGIISFTCGNTTTKKYYDYTAAFFGSVNTGTYDASEAFDDTIAAAISPYKKSSIVPFKEGFLAGFYADKATVEPEVYKTKMNEKFSETIKKEIKEQLNNLDTPEEMIQESFPVKDPRYESYLFPVWFLTWRKKDRVAYSVMNGETGTVCAEVPVDYKKFFFVAFIVAAILALILSYVPVFFIPFKVAVVAGILLYLSSFILKSELKKINQTENHVFDLGSALHKDDDSSKKNGKKKKTAGGCFLSGGNVLQYLILFYCFYKGWFVRLSEDVQSFFGMMIFFQAILFVKQFKELKGIKSKAGIVSMILSVVAYIAGGIVASTGSQDDVYYYGIAVGCLAVMIVNIVTSIFYTNYLATRPVPNFYTREGANNGR